MAPSAAIRDRLNFGPDTRPEGTPRDDGARRPAGSADPSNASRTPPCSRAAAATSTISRVRAGTLHAAILRSPHAHAVIRSIDTARRARALPGVAAVLTGAEVTALSASLAGRRPRAGPVLADRRRSRALCRRAGRGGGGERPLSRRGRAGTDRGRLRAAAMRWSIRIAALDGNRAAAARGLGSNVASDRTFRYGDPESAFATAARTASPSTCAIRAIPARRSRPTA